MRDELTLVVEDGFPFRLGSHLVAVDEYTGSPTSFDRLGELLHERFEARDPQTRAHDQHEVGAAFRVGVGEGEVADLEGGRARRGFVVEGNGGSEESLAE